MIVIVPSAWVVNQQSSIYNQQFPLCSISKNIAVWARLCAMRWSALPSETCLIEADRDREKTRLTYSDFKEISLPLARALEDADFDAGDRAAILMTNQSKWLISAYAIFHSGGVLVPLDYKLTAAEQLQLLEHSQGQGAGGGVLPVAGDHAVA